MWLSLPKGPVTLVVRMNKLLGLPKTHIAFSDRSQLSSDSGIHVWIPLLRQHCLDLLLIPLCREVLDVQVGEVPQDKRPNLLKLPQVPSLAQGIWMTGRSRSLCFKNLLTFTVCSPICIPINSSGD